MVELALYKDDNMPTTNSPDDQDLKTMLEENKPTTDLSNEQDPATMLENIRRTVKNSPLLRGNLDPESMLKNIRKTSEELARLKRQAEAEEEKGLTREELCNLYAERRGIHRYDNDPELQQAMAPYERMFMRLLLSARWHAETRPLFDNMNLLVLRTAENDSFSSFNMADRETLDFLQGFIVANPDFVTKSQKKAKKAGKPFSEDVLVFAMAHEFGHSLQFLNKIFVSHKESEFLADETGVFLAVKSGYSLYNIIRDFPLIGAEYGGDDHPPLSERRLKMIEFGIKNNLFREEETKGVEKLRAEINSFLEHKRKLKKVLTGKREDIDENTILALIDGIEKQMFDKDDLASVFMIIDEKTAELTRKATQHGNTISPNTYNRTIPTKRSPIHSTLQSSQVVLMEPQEQKKAIASLQTGISRVLAKAFIESRASPSKYSIDSMIDYLSRVETAFLNKQESLYWENYGINEYKQLEKDGIINAQGRILDMRKLVQSPLIQNTPDTFRAAGCAPIQFAYAPCFKNIRNNTKQPDKNPSHD